MASYAYISYQSQVFIFDNKLSEYFNSTLEVQDNLIWKVDLKKTENNISQLFILGIYSAFQSNNTNNQDEIYTLNVGRMFEISMYDFKGDESNKVFEECYLTIHSNLEKITNDNIKLNFKEFVFRAPDVVGFHARLSQLLSQLA